MENGFQFHKPTFLTQVYKHFSEGTENENFYKNIFGTTQPRTFYMVENSVLPFYFRHANEIIKVNHCEKYYIVTNIIQR